MKLIIKIIETKCYCDFEIDRFTAPFNKYNQKINIKAFRTLPFPAMKSLLVYIFMFKKSVRF